MNRKKLLLAAMILCLPLYGLSEKGQNDKEKNIKQIMEKSGIEKQFAQLPAVIESQMTMRKNQFDNEKYDVFVKIMKDSFTSETIINEIKNTFIKSYNEKYVQDILKFYDSELTKKITELEVKGTNPDLYRKALEFDIQKLSPARKKIFDKFINDTGMIDYAQILSIVTMEGFLKSFNTVLPKEKRLTDSQIDEIKKMIKKKQAGVDQKIQFIKIYAVIYEQASDKELNDYCGFYSTKSGKWMTASMRDGTIKGINTCSSIAGKKLGEALSQKKV